jgi:prevent-host-death family protein
MRTVQLSEARRRLSDLVRAAERGESVSITRRGKEVARLVPPEKGVRKPLPDLTEFRKPIEIKGKPLSQTVIDMRDEERC